MWRTGLHLHLSTFSPPILIPVHKNSFSYRYKNVYKNGENHLSESTYSSSYLFSPSLYRSALATTSLYLFLLCSDFPFYRLLHIWRRGSVHSLWERRRPASYTHGSSCGLIYPFALCSIQWDFSKSLSWSVKGISLTFMCASGTLLAQGWAYSAICVPISFSVSVGPLTTFSHEVVGQDRQSAHIYLSITCSPLLYQMNISENRERPDV